MHVAPRIDSVPPSFNISLRDNVNCCVYGKIICYLNQIHDFHIITFSRYEEVCYSFLCWSMTENVTSS